MFDGNGLWTGDDATSAVAWLKTFAQLSGGSASLFVTFGRRLRVLPAMAAALDDGSLSFDQARLILGCVDADLTARFAAVEAELVPLLARLDQRALLIAMRVWRERARAEADRERPPAEPARSLHLNATPDGSWHLDATLGPEAGKLLDDALHQAASRDAEGEPPRSPAQRRADALADLARWFLDHRQAPPRNRRRPHLELVAPLDGDGPGRDADGTVVDRVTIDRISCDTFATRVLYGADSHILDYGHATRTVPAALFRTLVVRDRHCRWPGCDRTADWCEAHHVVHWLRHGPTRLDNLVLLCTRHHHRLHEPGWCVVLRSDATLVITTPTGRTLTTHAAPLLDPVLADTG